MKEISLKDSVYDLVKKNPEVKEILIGMGFTPLRDKAMLNTAGRMMTLGRAAKQFGLSHETIEKAINPFGYTLKEKEL